MNALPDFGVRVSVEELMRLRADAGRLVAPGRDPMGGLFPGGYRALFRGRGLEFEEVRAYQHGDDYRTVDWRVTARTGRLHTKLFREDRERTLAVVLDAGAAMQFGTQGAFKWVAAARVAALFAWLALESGDPVAGVLHGRGRYALRAPAGRGQGAALRLFRQWAGVAPDGAEEGSRLGDALAQLRRDAPPGSAVLLVGDFRDLERAGRHLARLVRHHDLLAIRITDPLERELPAAGWLAFRGEGETVRLDGADGRLRERYVDDAKEEATAIANLFRRYRIPYAELSTEQPLVEGLREAFFAP